MSELQRQRKVVGKHSTWFVCDVHNWDYTGEGEDICPVCLGESNKEAEIITRLNEAQAKSCSTHCFQGYNPTTHDYDCGVHTTEYYIKLVKGEL